MKVGIEERIERIEKLLIINAKQVLNAGECALMLGISESRVRHLACDKDIPHYKKGKLLFFKKSEIEDWMLRDRVPTNEEIREKASTYCLTKN